MNKFKILLFDLFFIISGIIGVGFATGKEIAHFFLSGKRPIVAIIIFFIIFVGLSLYFLHIKNKHNISTLTDLNKLAFGKYYQVCNILLVIMFTITNSAMLAGCDNLASTYLEINIPIFSLFLSFITYFIVIGGVNRIKSIANTVMPLIILIIIINACTNMGGGSSLQGNVVLDVVYPIFFCCENFIILISVLLSTKSNPKLLSFISGTIISFVLLVCVLSIGSLNLDMPMLSLSKNLGNIFFAIYLIGVIFALFTTLEITAYNCLEVSTKNKYNKHFALFLILCTSQMLSYLGFNFIVKYLYTLIGTLGAIYLILLIIKLIIINKKT